MQESEMQETKVPQDLQPPKTKKSRLNPSTFNAIANSNTFVADTKDLIVELMEYFKHKYVLQKNVNLKNVNLSKYWHKLVSMRTKYEEIKKFERSCSKCTKNVNVPWHFNSHLSCFVFPQ